MSLRFASNCSRGQPCTTQVRSSWVGITPHPRSLSARMKVSKPSVGNPLQYA